MDLKVEARNLDMRNGWQEKIEEEREKLSAIMQIWFFISVSPLKLPQATKKEDMK